MAKFYAVKNGRIPGIYETWDDCKAQTDGFPSAKYKSFKTAAEAAEYMGWISDNVKEADAETCASGEIIAYVDGSYNISTGEYGWGAVLITSEGEIELSETGNNPELAVMRNVAGEIKGSEAAMRYALENGYRKITIYHDYEGIAKWCTGEWKTNKEGTIQYKKIYNEISAHLQISFVKVKGHSGDKYNDIADRLAKKAAGVE